MRTDAPRGTTAKSQGMAVALLLLSACGTPPAERTHDPTHPIDRCPVCSMYARIKHAVVRIATPRGAGSGAIIDERGWIVTNRHVVGEDDEVDVRLFDGRTFKARVTDKGKAVDLALVELPAGADRLMVLPIGSTQDVQEGEEIYVIGHPLDLRWSITRGIISRIRGTDDPAMPNRIQIDAPINPGNSGGPLLSRDGKLIGVVTSKIVGGGAENIGFACPCEKLVEFLQEHTRRDKR